MPAWRGVPSLLVPMAVCLHANQMQDQPNSWYLGPLAWSLQAFAGRAASTSLVTWLAQGCREQLACLYANQWLALLSMAVPFSTQKLMIRWAWIHSLTTTLPGGGIWQHLPHACRSLHGGWGEWGYCVLGRIGTQSCQMCPNPTTTLYSLGSKCKPKPMDRIIRRMRGKADRRLYWQTNKLLSNF
jgi:hypothetical protein